MTFATNVQGTVNLLEAIRGLEGIAAVLVVTTDKVYENNGDKMRFAETDPLGGSDPYSASKAAAELVVSSYAKSFFESVGVPVATARAGNVIGGGDWSWDRLVPDIWRALHAGEPIALRYPSATRPWQHVMEPLSGYLSYLQALSEAPDRTPRALNFGPEEDAGEVTVAAIADALQKELGVKRGWVQAKGDFPPEMIALALDSSKAAAALGWRPRLDPARTVEWTADWYRRSDRGQDVRALTLGQIIEYESLA
jgi:CDP-glucose 4,6-dehydratase